MSLCKPDFVDSSRLGLGKRRESKVPLFSFSFSFYFFFFFNKEKKCKNTRMVCDSRRLEPDIVMAWKGGARSYVMIRIFDRPELLLSLINELYRKNSVRNLRSLRALRGFFVGWGDA